MDSLSPSRHYQPSTELQRQAVEAGRNAKRLERYRNIQLYLWATQVREMLERGRR